METGFWFGGKYTTFFLKRLNDSGGRNTLDDVKHDSLMPAPWCDSRIGAHRRSALRQAPSPPDPDNQSVFGSAPITGAL
jgi:hypothetical protein